MSLNDELSLPVSPTDTPPPAPSVPSSVDDLSKELTLPHTPQSFMLDMNIKSADLSGTDAARAKRVLDAQKKTGLPINMVDSQLDLVEQEAKKSDFNAQQFTKDHPEVSKWMSENPQQAALGRDDHVNLGLTEKLLRTHPLIGSAVGLFNRLAGNKPGEDTTLEVLQKSTKQAGYSLLASHGGLEQAAAITGGTRTFDITPQEALDHAKEMGLIGKDENIDLSQGLLNNQRALDAVMTAANDLERIQTEQIQKTPLYQQGAEKVAFAQQGIQENQPKVSDAGFKYYLGQGTQAFFSSVLPMMGVSLATGGAALPGLGVMGVQVYGQKLGEQIQAGRSIREAQADAWFYALAETIPEQIPLSTALKEGAPLFKRLLKTAWQEGAQEMFTEVLEAGYDSGVLNQDMTLGQAFRRVADAGIVGALMGVGMAGVGHAAQLPTQIINNRRNKLAAQENENFFKALGDTSKDSKLRESLPDRYQELVGRMTKDGPIENLYTPIEFFQSHFQEAGVDPRQVAVSLGIADAYDQAVASGSKLAIPTAAYAAKIAPTDHNAAFVKELTTTPDSLSSRELDDLQEELKQAVKQAAEQQGTAFEQSLEKVREDVLARLSATMSQSEAKHQADLWAERMRSRADILGLDPWELYQQHELTVTREGIPQIVSRETNQEKAAQIILNQQGMAPAQRMAGDLAKGPALTLTPNTVPGEGPYRVTHWLDGQPVRHEAFPDTTTAQKAFDQALTETNTTAEKMGEKAITEQQTLYQSAAPKPLELVQAARRKGPVTRTKAFKQWFGKSKVVNDEGKPFVVYHGTTHDFDVFTTEKATVESDFGAGYYFSNNTEDVSENYAGEGLDLTQRIELRAERIFDELSDKLDERPNYNTSAYARLMKKARKMARDELSGGAPNIIPVYLSFQNPLIIGGDNETRFDMELQYDIDSVIDQARKEVRSDNTEDGKLTIDKTELEKLAQERAQELSDENGYTEYGGPLLDFTESLAQVASRFNDTDKIVDTISDIQGREDIGAEELVELLKKSEGIVYATDEEGNLSSGELIRQAFEHAGYDGIIDNSVNRKFGSEKRVGRPMAGMDYGTVHYIAFKPEQIKSAIGNRGTFDPNQANILYQSAQQPIFYSGLLKAIETAKQQSASAADWKAIVKKLPGVKQDEIDAVGLNEWLDIQKGQVTREQVSDFVRANGVQVQEVHLGETTPDAKKLADIQAQQQELSDKVDAARHKMAVDEGINLDNFRQLDVANLVHWAWEAELPEDTSANVKRHAQQALDSLGLTASQRASVSEYGKLVLETRDLNDKALALRATSTTKFGSYQLPGGENYRELLLTLPEKESPKLEAARAVEEAQKNYERQNDSANYAALIRAREAADKIGAEWEPAKFRSSHFDEPNILAHVRFNERISAPEPNRGRVAGENFFNREMAPLLPLDVVHFGVVGLAHHDQVQRAIISALPVDVVNLLKTLDLTPKDFFGDKAVRSRAVLLSADHVVRARISAGLGAALRDTETNLRAKVRDSLSAGLNQEILPTLRTSDLDASDITRLLSSNPIRETTGAEGVQSDLVGASSPAGAARDISVRGGEQIPADLAILLDTHAKMLTHNERGKRVLFIEEVQSDWAQQGRKKGFLSKVEVKIEHRPKEDAGWPWALVIDNHVIERHKTRELAEREAPDLKRRWKGGVPDAPFVTKTESWAMLAMKRMIRYAAENGYDKLAFTTGTQQAARYDLSKQLSRVEWKTKPVTSDIAGNLVAYDKNGNAVIDKNIPPHSLPDYIGKDAADKILKADVNHTTVGGNEVRRLDGLDLKVGGEGMKAFYDEMLPQMVNKYVKKWGGKVSKTVISVSEGNKPQWKDFRIVPSYPEIKKPGTHHIEGLSTETNTWQLIYGGVGISLEDAEEQLIRSKNTSEKLWEKYRKSEKTEAPSIDITTAMRDAVMQGQTLFQKERGVIRFTDKTVNIELFKDADLSTFLHESGHVFLLQMLDDVRSIKAIGTPNEKQQRLVEDFNKLLTWMGISEEQLMSMSPEAIKAHEQFARGFEAYLAEGKAPSTELRSAFQRFKAWLMHVYRLWKKDASINQTLDVHLNAEVRGIMDRLIATEDQINAARQDSAIRPVFTDAVEAGMSDTEFAAYRKLLEETNQEAQTELEQKAIREFQREREKWWKESREKIRAEVGAEVDKRPIYKTLAELQREDGPKLDRTAIKERFKDRQRSLPRGITVEKDGIDPDTAAEMFGFKSGEELVNQLSTMMSRNKIIEAETDARMVQEHGNMMVDGTMIEKAKEAVRGEGRSEVIRKELQALQKKAREVKPFVEAAKKTEQEKQKAGRQIYLAAIPSVAEARDTAERALASTKIRDIRPMQYYFAARKAAKAAFESVQKGDYILAAVNKRQELIANEMFRAASKAQTEINKILDSLKKYEKKTTRERLAKYGADFLEQIDALLARYNLHPQSETVLAKKKMALREWYDSQVALGFEPTIDPDLMDEARRQNYKDVPLDDLRALNDAVKSIAFIASRQNKIATMQAEKEYTEAVDEMAQRAEESLKKLTQKKERILENWLDRQKNNLTGHAVDLVPVETLIEMLDGGATGPWHDYMFNLASESQSAYYDMQKEIGKKVGDIIDSYIKKNSKHMVDLFQTDLQEEPMSRYKLLSIAFNIGNESNFEKLVKGMKDSGWSEQKVMDAVKQLSAEDFTFIQKIWDTIDTLYKPLNELQKRVSGLPLPKIEARPVHLTLKDGSKVDLSGGYYPVKYDPDFSMQGVKQDTGPIAGLTEKGYARATAPDSFRKTRTKFAAPLLFDFNYVIQKHLSGVMKDLTHREFLIDMNRLVRDQRIRKVLQERLGREYEKMFMPWLKGVANDGNSSVADLTGWDRRFEMARSHVTVVALGFKATSMLAQLAGVSNSLEYIGDNYGSAYLVSALGKFISNPLDTLNQVKEKSGEMRHRYENIDREVRDELTRLSEAHKNQLFTHTSNFAEMAERAAFYGINFMDRVVSVPTWLAAYQGALDQMMKESPSMDPKEIERKAVHAGDAAVRRTQGAGGAKDLSTIQRKRGVMKILTMFYTPFAAWYGRLHAIGSKLARSDNRWRYTPEAVMHVLLITAIPTILAELLAGRGPRDCEKKSGSEWAACMGRWAAIKAGFSLAAPFPVIRDIANGLEDYAIDGRPRDTRFSPVLDAINRVVKTGGKAGSVMFGDKPLKADLAFDLFETSGYFMGVPTAQPRITMEYLYDLMTDKESPENPLEFMHGLAYRRSKK